MKTFSQVQWGLRKGAYMMNLTSTPDKLPNLTAENVKEIMARVGCLQNQA